MELANLYCSQRTSTLQAQFEMARNLGFQGLGLLAEGRLPSAQDSLVRGEGEHTAVESHSGRISVVCLDLLCSDSEGLSGWKQVPIPVLLKLLKAYGCAQVLVPSGCDLRLELRERAEKLLARVRSGEVIHPEEEALEQFLGMAEQEAERQLERFAAYLHALRAAAPGLGIAVRPEPSAASLLNPQRLRLLQAEIGGMDIAYWHDTGICAMRQAGGLEEPGAWLDGFANILCGSTLHDFAGGAVHLPPGLGNVDWALLREYLPRQTTRILAIAPSYPKQVLVEARTSLQSRLPA